MPRATSLLLLALSVTTYAADADPFDPSASLAGAIGTLQGEAPLLFGEGPSAGIMLGFAQNLIVLEQPFGPATPAFSSAMPINIYGGYTYRELFRVDLFVPIYAYADVPLSNFEGAALGDIRIQGLIPVYEHSDYFAIAIVPRIGLPTGNRNAMIRRGFHASVGGAFGGETNFGLGYLANLDLTVSGADSIAGVGMGSSIDFLAGAYYRATDAFRLGADVKLRMGLVKGDEGNNHVGTLHLFANHTLPVGLGMTVGAGSGFLAGLGAPEYRVFAGLTYANLTRDRDGDGYVDNVDGCPEDPEDFDEFEDEDGCPEADNDGDTIADVSDSCPMEREDFDEFEDENGCPDPDNDGDGLLDADDACPMERGQEFHFGCPDQDLDGLADTDDLCPEKSGPWETRGCPDQDMDEVPDTRDECPNEPRSMDDSPDTSNGCPPKQEAISGGMIRLGEKMVHFDSGSYTLKPGSHPPLNELANLLKANPGIKRGEISGHTDNEGGEAMNMRLSQRRAEAVLNYLAERGISRSRLVARGYGEMRSIDTNRTARGRANNRRVEFRILEQQDQTLREPGEMTPLQRGAVTIELFSTWGNVTIDGRKVSQPAPFRQLPLLIGSHDIAVYNAKEGLDYEVTVTIAEGETTTISVPFGDQSGPWDAREEELPGLAPEEVPELAPEPEVAPGEAEPLDEIGEPWILEEPTPAPEEAAPTEVEQPESVWGSILPGETEEAPPTPSAVGVDVLSADELRAILDANPEEEEEEPEGDGKKKKDKPPKETKEKKGRKPMFSDQ